MPCPMELSKPRVETQAALGHSLLQLYQGQQQMLPQLSGTQLHLHNSSWGVEGTWETQISKEEFGTDRNFPAACLPGSPSRDRERKGVVNTYQLAFKGLISLSPLPTHCVLYSIKDWGLRHLFCWMSFVSQYHSM